MLQLNNIKVNGMKNLLIKTNLLSRRQSITLRLSFFQEEETVDHYLQYLKWREFTATKKTGFPPSRPLEETLSHIEGTEIYRALWNFPKGGNMHTHESRLFYEISEIFPDLRGSLILIID